MTATLFLIFGLLVAWLVAEAGWMVLGGVLLLTGLLSALVWFYVGTFGRV